MQVGIAAVNFVCGFILVIGSYVMEGLEETRDMQRWLVHVFRCVPPFNLGASPHAGIADVLMHNACAAKWQARAEHGISYSSGARSVLLDARAGHMCP